MKSYFDSIWKSPRNFSTPFQSYCLQMILKHLPYCTFCFSWFVLHDFTQCKTECLERQNCEWSPTEQCLLITRCESRPLCTALNAANKSTCDRLYVYACADSSARARSTWRTGHREAGNTHIPRFSMAWMRLTRAEGAVSGGVNCSLRSGTETAETTTRITVTLLARSLWWDAESAAALTRARFTGSSWTFRVCLMWTYIKSWTIKRSKVEF